MHREGHPALIGVAEKGKQPLAVICHPVGQQEILLRHRCIRVAGCVGIAAFGRGLCRVFAIPVHPGGKGHLLHLQLVIIKSEVLVAAVKQHRLAGTPAVHPSEIVKRQLLTVSKIAYIVAVRIARLGDHHQPVIRIAGGGRRGQRRQQRQDRRAGEQAPHPSFFGVPHRVISISTFYAGKTRPLSVFV